MSTTMIVLLITATTLAILLVCGLRKPSEAEEDFLRVNWVDDNDADVVCIAGKPVGAEGNWAVMVKTKFVTRGETWREAVDRARLALKSAP